MIRHSGPKTAMFSYLNDHLLVLLRVQSERAGFVEIVGTNMNVEFF